MGAKWIRRIETSDDVAAWVPVVIEISRGSRMKYELDEDTGQLRLARGLARGFAYPTDYGFIPRTRGGDGERIDVLVLASEPLLPLTIVRVRIVGGMHAVFEDEEEDKLLGVALDDPPMAEIRELDQVPKELRDSLSRFMEDHKNAEGEPTRVTTWHTREGAIDLVRGGMRAYRKKGTK
jgi:inorganic pyrophosphatase